MCSPTRWRPEGSHCDPPTPPTLPLTPREGATESLSGDGRILQDLGKASLWNPKRKWPQTSQLQWKLPTGIPRSKIKITDYLCVRSPKFRKPFLLYIAERQIAKAILRRKNSWRNRAPCLQTIPQSYSHHNSVVPAQNQKYKSMEQGRNPRNKPTHQGQ